MSWLSWPRCIEAWFLYFLQLVTWIRSGLVNLSILHLWVFRITRKIFVSTTALTCRGIKVSILSTSLFFVSSYFEITKVLISFHVGFMTVVIGWFTRFNTLVVLKPWTWSRRYSLAAFPFYQLQLWRSMPLCWTALADEDKRTRAKGLL